MEKTARRSARLKSAAIKCGSESEEENHQATQLKPSNRSVQKTPKKSTQNPQVPLDHVVVQRTPVKKHEAVQPNIIFDQVDKENSLAVSKTLDSTSSTNSLAVSKTLDSTSSTILRSSTPRKSQKSVQEVSKIFDKGQGIVPKSSLANPSARVSLLDTPITLLVNPVIRRGKGRVNDRLELESDEDDQDLVERKALVEEDGEVDDNISMESLDLEVECETPFVPKKTSSTMYKFLGMFGLSMVIGMSLLLLPACLPTSITTDFCTPELVKTHVATAIRWMQDSTTFTPTVSTNTASMATSDDAIFVDRVGNAIMTAWIQVTEKSREFIVGAESAMGDMMSTISSGAMEGGMFDGYDKILRDAWTLGWEWVLPDGLLIQEWGLIAAVMVMMLSGTRRAVPSRREKEVAEREDVATK